jgi:hypothetical protein
MFTDEEDESPLSQRNTVHYERNFKLSEGMTSFVAERLAQADQDKEDAEARRQAGIQALAESQRNDAVTERRRGAALRADFREDTFKHALVSVLAETALRSVPLTDEFRDGSMGVRAKAGFRKFFEAGLAEGLFSRDSIRATGTRTLQQMVLACEEAVEYIEENQGTKEMASKEAEMSASSEMDITAKKVMDDVATAVKNERELAMQKEQEQSELTQEQIDIRAHLAATKRPDPPSLFQSIVIGATRSQAGLSEGTKPAIQDAFVEAIVTYSLLETVNTLGVAKLNAYQAQKLAELFAAPVK